MQSKSTVSIGFDAHFKREKCIRIVNIESLLVARRFQAVDCRAPACFCDAGEKLMSNVVLFLRP